MSRPWPCLWAGAVHAVFADNAASSSIFLLFSMKGLCDSYSLDASDVSVLTNADLFHLRGALERDRDRLETDLASLDEVSAPLVAPAIHEHTEAIDSLLARLDEACSVLISYAPLED